MCHNLHDSHRLWASVLHTAHYSQLMEEEVAVRFEEASAKQWKKKVDSLKKQKVIKYNREV